MRKASWGNAVYILRGLVFIAFTKIGRIKFSHKLVGHSFSPSALQKICLPAFNEFPFPCMNHTSTQNTFTKHMFGRLFSASLNFVAFITALHQSTTVVTHFLFSNRQYLQYMWKLRQIFVAKLIQYLLAVLTSCNAFCFH